MRIMIINGPNLNLLGKREPALYGTEDFNAFLDDLRAGFPEVKLGYFQSNVEGELIDAIHQADQDHDGIILNAAAYTHTSVAIGDAVAAIQTPVVEVHISNIFSREDYRQLSFIAPHARGSISGFGLKVYRLAILSFLK
jgi:3-dehydroquinate dehydratase-2